jgi:hypothetical protein
MKATDYTKFKQALIKAIDKHLAKGGQLVAGDFGRGKRLCPISCLSGDQFHSKGKEIDQAIAQKTDTSFTDTDMWEFVLGFDTAGHMKLSTSKMYKLGAKIRAKYLPEE